MTHKELLKKVQKILWMQWDPIGTRAMGGPDDEYNWYAPRVVSMLRSGARAYRLEHRLMYWALQRMGVPLSVRVTKCTLRAAKALEKLGEKL